MGVTRFSLRTLLIATAYVAVVVGGLVSGSDLWADIIFSVTLAITLVATLAALFGSNALNRIFWRGFCVIAWSYLLLTFGLWSVGQLRDHLVTDQLLKPLHRTLAPLHAARHVEPGFELQAVGENQFRTGPNSIYDVWGGFWQTTGRIGHSAWAILLGLIGGYLAEYFSKNGTIRLPAD